MRLNNEEKAGLAKLLFIFLGTCILGLGIEILFQLSFIEYLNFIFGTYFSIIGIIVIINTIRSEDKELLE